MPRIPKEAGIKKYLIDADIIEERKEKQKSGLVINPLSTLRFTDPIGTAFLEAKRPDLFEKEGQVDLSKEIQRSGIDGLTRAI